MNLIWSAAARRRFGLIFNELGGQGWDSITPRRLKRCQASALQKRAPKLGGDRKFRATCSTARGADGNCCQAVRAVFSSSSLVFLLTLINSSDNQKDNEGNDEKNDYVVDKGSVCDNGQTL